MASMDGFEERETQGGGIDVAPVTVTTIGGKQFAVALLWGEVEEKKNAAAEARQMAARPNINGDLYCMRSAAEQFGIGRKLDGHARNMPSLAAALADTLQGSWLGIFEVEGGYYLLGVRDDLIMAETDRVFRDELEARARFEDMFGATDWSKTYAPERFDIDGTDVADLTGLLKGVKPPRLMDVDRVSSLTKVAGFVALAAAVLVGGLWYQQHLQDVEWQQQMADMEARAKATVGMKDPEVVIPPMPWEQRFKGAPYLQECMTALRRVAVDIPGWRTGKVECSGSAARAELDRTAPLGQGGGTINWVRWGLDKHGMKDATASPVSADKVVVSWSVKDSDRWVVDIKTPRLSDARRYLQSWFEEQFVKIQFPQTENGQYWRTLKFSFETSYDPVTFAPILEKVQGLVVDKVTLDLKRLTYIVEGAAYEQLDLPKNAKRQQAVPAAR